MSRYTTRHAHGKGTLLSITTYSDHIGGIYPLLESGPIDPDTMLGTYRLSDLQQVNGDDVFYTRLVLLPDGSLAIPLSSRICKKDGAFYTDGLSHIKNCPECVSAMEEYENGGGESSTGNELDWLKEVAS